MRPVKKPQNCWEYWACVKAIREKCLVYQKNYGARCWFLAICCQLEDRRFEHCWQCPWYRQNNTPAAGR